MFRKRMTKQEIRLECAKLSVQAYQQFIPEIADDIYNYVTSLEESKVSQKKPRVHFVSHLCSRIQNLLK